jgi:hypothetical protein
MTGLGPVTHVFAVLRVGQPWVAGPEAGGGGWNSGFSTSF